MENPFSGHRRSSRTKPAESLITRTLKALSLRSNDAEELSEDARGYVGLTPLYTPSEPVAELVFVHGLRGGSRKTWSKSEHPFHFWPKEWLSRDPDFRAVRIHTFGYHSDWAERKESILNIHDFAQNLMGDLNNSRLLRRDDDLPIIFIAHSMGGLVVKKACLLAQQDPAFRKLGDRFHTIFFLATPHRGSDSAQLLSNLLRLSHGTKPYLSELIRQSSSTEAINEGFRHFAPKIQLRSFYETLATNLGVTSSLVVEKSSAVLGYPNERADYLEANHRNICKYDTPSDRNYMKLRDSLVSVVDEISEQWLSSKAELHRDQKRSLESLLGVHEIPVDDLEQVEGLCTQDSCDWFINKDSFQKWRDEDRSRVLWITAKPATGKSVLAGHVINHLESANKDCSYYFFSHNRKSTSDLGRCLRSIAYQMALLNPTVRDRIIKLQQDGVQFDKDSYQFVWKRVFIGAILSAELHQPHYWIIDALDECLHGSEFFSMLAKIEEAFPLRVLITSRVNPETTKRPLVEGENLIIERIPLECTMNDIRLFITANMHRLPLDEDDQDALHDLTNNIIAKSDGCFLWVRLVIDQLSRVYSSTGIRKVLAEVPAGMDSLYTRILETLSQAPVNKPLAKAIFRWTVCSVRPLTTDELRLALQLDISDKIFNADNTIASACGQLVHVDANSRVRMVHQTAREFLIGLDPSDDFSIQLRAGHGRLAEVCLKFLSGPGMKPPSSRRPDLAQLQSKRSPFVDYACTSFYEHIKQTSSADDMLLTQLGAFLDSPEVLSWIEYVAQTANLNHLIRTGKVFNRYLERRAKHVALLGEEVQILEAWGTDLIRLVGRFGTNLLSLPSSIHALIPAFCPAESALYRQFGSTQRGLTVSGLSAASWDDRLSCFIYGQSEQPAAVACNDNSFVVGMSKGTIFIYQLLTCQKTCQLKHGEAVKVLEINPSGERLASGGRHKIKLWDLSTDCQIWEFQTSHQTLSLAFFETDKTLLAALRDNQMVYIDSSDGSLIRNCPWLDERNGEQFRPSRPPTKTAVALEMKLLGINYRGRLIMWDLEADCFLGVCGKEDSQQYAGQPVTQTSIMDFVFNPLPNLQLLAAAYQDGSLALLDPIEGITHQVVSRVDAQILASSHDGRTLASGDAFGTIQLFEFENLKIIYRLKSDDVGINRLVFSTDSLRFIDIRGRQCNVWAPTVLVRNETDEENSDIMSTTLREVQITEADDVDSITAIACHGSADIVFCGDEAGSVSVFDSATGRKMQELYTQTRSIAITLLALSETNDWLASADLSGKVIVRKILRHSGEWKAEEYVLNVQIEESITQIVLNSAPPRLLISSPSYDRLFALEGSLVGKHEASKRAAWRYARYPKQRRQLLLVTDGSLHILSWDDLRQLTPPEGITLNHTKAESGSIKSLSTYSNGSVLGIEFSQSLHHGPLETFSLWEISSLDTQATHPKSVIIPNSLSMRFRHIIGAIGTKLIFMEVSGWVCSIDLTNTTATDYSKHFFVPSDWLSSAMDLIFHLTPKGNFIFVKGNEIAVIKKRLNNPHVMPISRIGSW